MADNLSKIFGTEKDRVNCPFFFKIGACRHGEACTRLHHKPAFSQTLLLIALYKSPVEDLRDQSGPRKPSTKDSLQKHYEHFYEDIFLELSMYGEIEDLHVVDNLGEHMVGNVYCKYKHEESSDLAQKSLLGRFYAGQPIIAELSPVTDFREARCRQYEEAKCSRGGYCNFMHIKAINRDLRRKLWDEQTERYAEARKRRRDKRKAMEAEERDREVEKSQEGSRDRSIERREKEREAKKEKEQSRSQSAKKEKEKEKEKARSRDRSKSPRKARSKSPSRRDRSPKRETPREEPTNSVPPPMWKCAKCGGWGKDLVAHEGGMCAHCQRLSSGDAMQY